MPQEHQRNNYKVELCFEEWCLITALRNKFQYGEVIIMMRDGVPQRIKQAFTTDNLDKITENSVDSQK